MMIKDGQNPQQGQPDFPGFADPNAPGKEGSLVQEHLSELEHLYGTAPVGLCLMDTKLRFVRINERLAEINGKAVAEHIGRTLQEIIPEIAAQVEPIYRRVMETAQPELDFEVHGVTPSEPKIERDWLVSYYPLKSADGRIQGVSTVVQEITERKQTELKLAEANKLLEQRVRQRTRELSEVVATIEHFRQQLEAENIYLREELKEEHDFEEIIGKSDAIQRILQQANDVASTGATVLLLGETGTGKELIAHAIHDRGRLSKRPFVKVNCAALPATLIETELFGHDKGAFTGASSDTQGRFEIANGGTIFLD